MRTRWLLPLGLLVVTLGVALWATLDPGDEPAAALEPVPADERPARAERPADRGGLSLWGVVVAPDGRPVAGAEVSLSRDAAADLLAERCPICEEPLSRCDATGSFQRALELLGAPGLRLAEATVRSGSDGTFRFEDLGATSYTVWARAGGFAPEVRERAAPGEPARLVLLPVRTLRGQVVDEEGRAVPGARVLALSRVPEPAEAKTDAKGAFALTPVGNGPFYVVAGAPGFVAFGLLAAAADGQPLRLELARARVLDVTVRRRGKPADAEVRVVGRHLARERPARGGAVRFQALPPGEVTVLAAAPGLASRPRNVVLADPFTQVVLDLEPGGTLAVTVVDELGMPVPEPVLALQTGQEPLLTQQATSGEHVVLGPVAPGSYVLWVTAEGHQDSTVRVEVGEDEQPVEVVLRRAARISGRVIDEYGRPAAGVVVNASPLGERATSGADGRFVMTVPNAALYTLEAHHSDWGGGQVQVNAPAEGVELQLQPRASAEATVLADGKPVEGAELSLSGGASAFVSDRPSGGDGLVVMRGVPPGEYVALAMHPEYFSERTRVKLEEGAVARFTVTLRPGAAIRGRVRDEQGAPVAGAMVGIRPGGARPATTDADGRFEARPVRASFRYRLDVHHPDHEAPAPVVATSETEVEVVLRRRQRFGGRMVDPAGAPIPHFRVDKQEFFAADGRFEAGLSERDGTVTFMAEAPGYQEQLVSRRATPELGDVTLERAPELTGVVRDGSGAPVASAEVGCDRCAEPVLTGADGRFRLALSGAGAEAQVQVDARKGSQSASARAKVGSPVELRLATAPRLKLRVFQADGSPAAGTRVDILGLSANPTVTSLVTAADGTLTAELSPGDYRIGRAAYEPHLLLRVGEGDQAHHLGAAPGTFRVTVRAKRRPGFSMWLVPGTLTTVENPPSSLHRVHLAQVQYHAGDGVTFRGVTPGAYTLVHAYEYGPAEVGPKVVPVQVRGDLEVDLEAGP